LQSEEANDSKQMGGNFSPEVCLCSLLRCHHI
jgi:hypothetical protein